jgi:hypothetical protein
VKPARLVALALACCNGKGAPPPQPEAGALLQTDAGALLSAGRVLVDLPARVDQCMLSHEGVLLDLGVPAARPLYGLKELGGVEATEHDGATWDRISTHTLTFRFAGPEGEESRGETYVDLHVRDLGARRLTAALNGKVVGTTRLDKGETAIKSIHANIPLLTSGTNELVLRFGGAGRAPDAVAEIDWIRVGTVADAAYAAPTYDGVVASETLAGVPRRAVALRAPAFVRCTGAFPKHATLDLSLGLLGKGSGDVDVRIVRDRFPPVVLGTTHVDDAGGWVTRSYELPDEAQGVGALEIRVDQATAATRVLVADAKLRAPPHLPPTRARPARSLVLVVYGQIPTTATTLPGLAALAQRGTSFTHQRATSTWPAAAVASMLTGLLPAEHGIDGDGARLVDGVKTVAEAASEAGIATAMFTANPTTTAGFGFQRGFQTFEASIPGTGPGEGTATGVIARAATWIGSHANERFFVVVHARGGHPPWDVPADQMRTLVPEGYSGPIEPGLHAAEILSRARHVPPLVRFNDADRQRAWALHDFAVSAHDTALARLVSALDEAGHKDDTAVLVTGDVGIDAAARVPFGDAEALDESSLSTPLVLHSAGQATSAVVSVPTSSIDVATTILAELGLSAPASFEGEDLGGAASDDGTRPIYSSTGEHLLVSWMGLSYRQTPTATSLCVPTFDPACASDASPYEPLTNEALRKLLSEAFHTRAAHQTPNLDGKTAVALTLWGR